MKHKENLRKGFSILFVLMMVLSVFQGLIQPGHVVHAQNNNNVREIQSGDSQTTIRQDGCDLFINKTQDTEWSVPRKPIDLVILQDTSGSFKNTIGGVQNALRELTTPVPSTQYDPDHPRLVFTDNPKTTDRVMVATFQGLDGKVTYDRWDTSSVYDSWRRAYPGYNPDSNFTDNPVYEKYDGTSYRINNTSLSNNPSEIQDFINNMVTEGGTPTVPALEDIMTRYSSQVQASQGGMENGRKTVFLLITDGVANGKRLANGKVAIEYSGARMYQLMRDWNLTEDWLYMEASQNILARAEELKRAGEQLKAAVGPEGSVVIGFWEDVKGFTGNGQYGRTYKEGFGHTNVNFGDNRSVQEIFSTTLRSMASPDKVVNGKNATFYVNEQNDINVFANKVLESVGAALVKEDVKGDFTITDGYKVKSVSINGKKIVETVTDKEKEIRGTVTQEGNNVKISVPDAAFNPGSNKFDYELVRTETAPPTNEDEEEEPGDDYTPSEVEREVGQLVGKFSVGEYSTTQIGSKDKQTVKVNDLSYCYPSLSKTITDGDASNDQGQIDDPIITYKKAYAANLGTVHEPFEYTVTYRMNNAPLNFKKNPILVDRVNYRLLVQEAYVTDMNGNRLDDFTIRQVQEADQEGNMGTTVIADIPKKPGIKTESVNEGEWGGHKWARYQLHIKARFNDQYPFDVNQKEYIKILQENDGLGVLNQGQIMWNGESNTPDSEGTNVRRSNSVFVVPPTETTITKKVRGASQTVEQGAEHYDLPLRDDEYYYDVKVAWPGLADKFLVEDELVPELEVVKSGAKPHGHDIEVMVNGKPVKALEKFISVSGNKVTMQVNKADITRTLNNTINRANKGNLGPAEIHIQIKAKIRQDANLDRFKDANGVVKIPNDASVTLDNKAPKKSEVVTVTPDEPAIAKKINDTLDDLYIPSWEENHYNYNIKTTLPGNIRDYGTYVIKDVLDERLELQAGQQPSIKGEDAKYFDVAYDEATRTITATMKSDAFGQIAGKSVVELVIPAKIKDGETSAKIPNTAKVLYNKQNATGDPKEITTPPVTVTPPPSGPTKKINGNLDDLVIPSAEENAYTYNIKAKLPGNIENYTQWGFKDTLDNRLELQPGQSAHIEGPNADKFTVTYDAATNTVTAEVKAGQFASLTAGQEIELVIPAKVKDGVTDKKIPNQATVYYNNPADGGVPRETPPTPPVTVTPPPTTPDISKTVNDVEHYQLATPEEAFTYKIDTKVPFNATAFKITDELKDVLEFVGTATATVDGHQIAASQITVSGKTLTVTLNEQELKDYQDKPVHVEFQAKIVDGANLEAYRTAEDGTEKVPNTAKFQINDNPKLEKETKPVTVTPPPSTPAIKKTVNDKAADQLATATTPFTYKIDTTVPRNAKAFRVLDTLEHVLQVDGSVTANIDGTEIPSSQITIEDVDVDGKTRQKISVTLTEEQVLKNAEKPVHVQFNAKIKDNADLSAYSSAADPTVKVPNKASFQVDNKPEVESDPVTVTPPPSTPAITKTVNDASHYQLQAAGEEFTYKIDTTIPQNATAFTVTDELKPVLDFGSGDVVATVDGVQTTGEITKNGQTLTVKFTRDEALKSGKPVHVEFKAIIRANADLTDYRTADDNTEKVPNTAKYIVNDDPNIFKESEPVTVTPPPTTPPITKTVNGAEHAQLNDKAEEFEYVVKTKVPRNITEFKVTDRLEPVLEVKGNVTATLDGKAIAADQIKVEADGDRQVVTVALTQEEVLKSAEKEVVVTFKAAIKADADLSSYTTAEDGTERVPNKASYGVNIPNVPDVDSNTVTVTPPPTKPDLKKTVNDAESYQLKADGEEFTYKLDTEMPRNITAMTVTDTLVDELDFGTGDVVATVDGVQTAGEITKTGQTLSVKFTAEEVLKNAGKAIHIEFKAKIRENANLDKYIDKTDGRTKVPNEGSYHINDNPDLKVKSKPVTVTPPPTTPEITKTVNDTTHYDVLTPEEEFTYKVETLVPTNATEFEVTDTIEPVLQFSSTPVEATVDGEAITNVTTVDRLLTVTLSREQVQAKAGKKVSITFKARFKEGVTLEELKPYVSQTDGVTRVPNKAAYRIDLSDQPNMRKESEPVTVTPPPTRPDITKKVNDVEDYTLNAENEVFTYTVETSVPENATVFNITDQLDPVLQFEGTPSATVDGTAIDASQITIQDQLLTVNLTPEQAAMAKKPVKLTFQARIRDNADLRNYVENGVIKVPNKATYHINNKPEFDKDSNRVTVTPPPTETTIEKKVDGADYKKLDAADQVFNYTVDVTVPKNATAFYVSDTLVPELQFDGEATATLDGKDLSADHIVKDDTAGKVTVTLTEEEALNNADKVLHLSFNAKVRPNADLSGYIDNNVIMVPNTAKYSVNHQPEKDSNTVHITPPPSQPDLDKKVNGKVDEQLATPEAEFTYTIDTVVPTHAATFTITDELKAELEFVGDATAVTATVGGEAITDVQINGQVLTVNLSQDQASKKPGQAVHVEFKAKIRQGANLSAYIVNGEIKVPNTAQYLINNEFKKESSPVTVTPPPSEEKIEKTVNDKQAETLETQESPFTYKIQTVVPANATAFAVSDTLDPVLELAGDVSTVEAKLGDDAIAASQVTFDAATSTLKVELTEAQAINNAKKAVTVTFQAKLKAGLTPAQLAPYIDATDGVTRVPNKARYSVNHRPDVDSNTVTVTPPPSTPDIEKKVNNDFSANLATREESFTYTLETQVPNNAYMFEIGDTLEPVLEFDGTATVELDGKDVTSEASVETVDAKKTVGSEEQDTKRLVVKLTQDQVTKNPGKSVKVTFKAKIKAGASLAAYITNDGVKIPNKANYMINNNPDITKDSNEVPVTPPPTTPDISKKVNGQAHVDLGARDEEFTYTIETTVPENATAFGITDTLVDALEFVGDASSVTATVDGETITNVKIEGQKLSVDLDKQQVLNKFGKAVKVEFKAKIKADADLTPHITADGVKVPNQAGYDINNDPKLHKDTEPVTVTPPPTTPDIEKKVNNKLEELLGKRDEVFTYTLDTTVPDNAIAFTVTDKLDPALEFAGNASSVKATVDNQAITDVKIEGDLLTVNLTQEQAVKLHGKPVHIEFTAKIKADANLNVSPYLTEDGVKVPNKAQYTVNNNPNISKESNVVPVTPPPTTPDIEKKVNGQVHADLAKSDEVFTYTINTTVPENATVFGITDTLVDALEFVGDASSVTATVDGEAITDVKIEGQTLKVNLAKTQVVNKFGKAVIVEFKAKIKADADLTPHITADGVRVPNRASYDIDNNPKIHKDSEPVTVTPPPTTPDIEKKVNNAYEAMLASHDETFTYTIDTTVPMNATAFTVTDTLVDVLEFVDTPTATVDGQAITDVQTSGQTLTVNLSKEQAINLHGKPVNVTFKAKIKAGANLNPYIVGNAGEPGNIKIPNKASYMINNDPNIRKDSNEVPVTPPPTTPDLEKKVNDADSAYLTAKEEVFTYSLDTVVPTAATAFAVLDKLEPVLEFVDKDQVVATLNGQVLDNSHITIMGQTIRVALTQEEVTSNAGKPVHIEFKAKIKEDADLTPYMTGQEDPRVPNKAQYIINNNPDLVKDSNEVPVVPPTKPDEPNITKAVNDQDAYQLKAVNEEFTYTITTAVPTNAHAFNVSDTLEPVLEFVGQAEVSANFAPLADTDYQVVQDGQYLFVQFSKEFVKANANAPIQIKFKAKIRDGADLTPYNTSGTPSVPNKASYMINNDPKLQKDSNIVPVTPPGPPTTPPGQKELYTESGSTPAKENKLELQSENEVFRYEVKAKQDFIPANSFHKQMKITDVLESVLGVQRTSIKIDSEKVDMDQALPELKELKDKLEDNEKKLKKLKGEDAASSSESSSAAPVASEPTVDPALQNARVAELEGQLAAAQATAQEKAQALAGLNEQLAATPEDQAEVRANLQAQVEAASAAQAEANAAVQSLTAQLESARAAAQAVASSNSVITSQLTPEGQEETPEQIAERVKGFEKLIKELKEQIKEYEDGKDSLDAEKGKKYQAIKDFNEAIENRDKVTGELTDESIAKLGELKVEGQKVTFEITNEYVLKLLEGRNIRLVIYARIVDQEGAKAAKYLADPNNGYVPNQATVEFDHTPEVTNIVYVKPYTPPTTPPQTPPTPPTISIPPANPGPELPATGEVTNLGAILAGFLMTLAGGYLTFRKRKDA